MKEIAELNFPEDVRYSESHEWVKAAGDTAKLGITDYAQDQLGDVVFVELPEEGAEFEKGEVFGCVESVKAVSDLFLPVGGAVAEVNRALEGSPQLVNENSYEEGWMIAVAPNAPAELEELLSHADYLEMLISTYTEFFHFYDAAPLLVVNSAEIDFVGNAGHFDALLDQILSMDGLRQYFNPHPTLL